MGIVKHTPKKTDILKMNIKKVFVKMNEEEKIERMKKNLLCSCCNVVFKSHYWLNKHINRDIIEINNNQKKANKILNLTCKCCNITWRDKNKMERHLSSKMITKEKRAVRKDKGIYKCSICDALKINNFYLKKHLLSCNKKNNKKIEERTGV